ncbi:uncharacterized protein K452DRAFT_300486 [Aplosporella prunicola CBS 121167]|uniref:Palmitoyltransferase n=1 Tax=Aplosporella prunicola CBS 121167 TaxID=1176127 RepID=A0A6A6B5N4_9PEZI|nr:uncharacterized protein K452DRAFT_300486 [Aplosporella prunicola CBS 121167]KAF2139452.1 hypothetical protein K452DRAFT_300486 [Aplosporella prunicola CBS 121167]
MEPLLRNIVIAVLSLSFLTFTVFFGRLPIFRKTPIGFLHRVVWVHFPAFLRWLDGKVTGGRIYKYTTCTFNYLFHEKHPLVVIFFLGLLSVAAGLFLHASWRMLPWYHRLIALELLPLPYLFTYLASRTRPNTVVTTSNYAEQVAAYPYDRIIFHPNNNCRTCRLPKPARSKHCSICKVCVARSDHHCVWVNNCLGRENYRWFLALLASTSVLLLYGAYLALILILYPEVNSRFTHYDHAFPAGLMSKWAPWLLRLKGFREDLNTVMVESIAFGGISITGVGLLAALTWPLPLGLLSYHIYLVWAGMTTNESSKWADWRDQMREGNVYVGTQHGSGYVDNPRSLFPGRDGRHNGHTRARATSNSYAEFGLRSGEFGRRLSAISVGSSPVQEKSNSGSPNLDTTIITSDIKKEVAGAQWPNQPHQVLVKTADGEAPREVPAQLEGIVDEASWQRCWKLDDVENVYDLGFWENLREILEG